MTTYVMWREDYFQDWFESIMRKEDEEEDCDERDFEGLVLEQELIGDLYD